MSIARKKRRHLRWLRYAVRVGHGTLARGFPFLPGYDRAAVAHSNASWGQGHWLRERDW